MIAWMYCVGEGWRSCEDATMSKSLPVASLFCWFCKYEVHELVYFLTFRKNGIMFCFVLFCSFGNRSESFLFEWSTFLFLVQKHWYVKFLRWVGWWGEGWVGWTAKRTTSRTCFLYISDKKGTFHFHFSDKIHIKRNFLKKGTKWQRLVNSPSLCICAQFSCVFVHSFFVHLRTVSLCIYAQLLCEFSSASLCISVHSVFTICSTLFPFAL